ncbi:unnamed protein product [Hydatigera taeniaeformis]|uniref:BRCT domain-containing protein n=1 Tax=Hydatigena taeniaeformis TaxID=6205 RepID=A0A0R3X3F8_HYDTA|nr:unnamed protein product [Hydatigera taeniaeformis]
MSQPVVQKDHELKVAFITILWTKEEFDPSIDDMLVGLEDLGFCQRSVVDVPTVVHNSLYDISLRRPSLNTALEGLLSQISREATAIMLVLVNYPVCCSSSPFI